MKRMFFIVSLMIAVLIPFAFQPSKVYNIDPDMWKAMGFDPNASSVSLPSGYDLDAAFGALDLDGDGFVDPGEVNAVNNGTAASYKGNKNASQTTPSSVSQQASGTTDTAGGGSTGKTKTKQVPANKVTATFKNLYGVIIGTSQITKGTDIAKSQFPKGKVPDIVTPNGTYVFDHWNYDGSKLTDDISVKAVYNFIKK